MNIVHFLIYISLEFEIYHIQSSQVEATHALHLRSSPFLSWLFE